MDDGNGSRATHAETWAASRRPDSLIAAAGEDGARGVRTRCGCRKVGCLSGDPPKHSTRCRPENLLVIGEANKQRLKCRTEVSYVRWWMLSRCWRRFEPEHGS